MKSLEEIWDKLLSRNVHSIEDVIENLSQDEYEEIFSHLKRMTIEADWHPEQKISANFALKLMEKRNGQ